MTCHGILIDEAQFLQNILRAIKTASYCMNLVAHKLLHCRIEKNLFTVIFRLGPVLIISLVLNSAMQHLRHSYFFYYIRNKICLTNTRMAQNKTECAAFAGGEWCTLFPRDPPWEWLKETPHKPHDRLQQEGLWKAAPVLNLRRSLTFNTVKKCITAASFTFKNTRSEFS